jgi:MFS family permease
LALGAIYAWSVFTPLLIDPHGYYQFSAQQTAWIFSTGLAFFAGTMVIAGKLQQQIGPRPVAILGGILLGAGYIGAGLFGDDFFTQLICIGVIGGIGIGLAYVVPIAVGVKWFPDKKGMITGLAVAGFGFGATIWVKIAGSWFGGLLNLLQFFNLTGVQSVFFLYGFLFLLLVLLGSLVMINPPENYKMEGFSKPVNIPVRDSESVEFTSGEMLRSPRFYQLWLVFIFSALSGLMVIYCIRLFGIDTLSYHGVPQAGIVAGTAMAWYAIFNGLGRILWGIISDHIGRRPAIITMTLCQAAAMLLIYHGFILFVTSTGLIIAASIIGFNFGGNFALFPAATADYFGNKNVGSNYGWMFTAYGVAGIAGPQIAGYFKDSAMDSGAPSIWMVPFIIAGISCLIGTLIMLPNKQTKTLLIVKEG